MISEKAVEAARTRLERELLRPVHYDAVKNAIEAALSLHDAPVECKQEAVAAERERCAQIVDDHAERQDAAFRKLHAEKMIGPFEVGSAPALRKAAAAIRASLIAEERHDG